MSQKIWNIKTTRKKRGNFNPRDSLFTSCDNLNVSELLEHSIDLQQKFEDDNSLKAERLDERIQLSHETKVDRLSMDWKFRYIECDLQL
jgi:hypothetical protein